MTKDKLNSLAEDVMKEFDENVFPEQRLFDLRTAADTLDTWWIQFICGICDSGYMPRLTLTLPSSVTDEWIKEEMRKHIQTHLSTIHVD